MAQKFDVCVLGATGLVGKTIMEILEQRDFPINKLYPLASARSAGEFIEFNGESIEVLDADNFDFSSWDVWENEPNILMPLIEYTEIASAHIAGYSLEGKSRGTEMLYQALCRKFEKNITKSLTDFLPEPEVSITEINTNFSEILLNQTVKMVYDVRRDDTIFRQQISNFGFDHIRKTYPVRREFSSLSIIDKVKSDIESSSDTNQTKLQPLYELGFKQTPLEEV